MYLIIKRISSSFLIVILLVTHISYSSQSSHKKKCPNFDQGLPSVINRNFFMPIRTETYKGAASVSSILPIEIGFKRNCDSNDSNVINPSNQQNSYKKFTDKLLKIQWKLQYHKSFSCIRIELDLGSNLTQFRDAFNFKYYMFSYREFAKQNIHLNRNLIVDRKNTLVLNQIEPVPYIICITFYATDDQDYRMYLKIFMINKLIKIEQLDAYTDSNGIVQATSYLI